MKSLFEILKTMEEDSHYKMEFNEDFRNIQSLMVHCNEFVKNFHKIQFRGGYEPYINEIVSRFLKVMRSKNYLINLNSLDPKYEIELRKITFYLILNTEATFKFDLNENHNVAHLLKSFPQFTKCLLMNVIWDGNLSDYFYDCLKYAPSWFILQFLDEALGSLRHAKPYDILDRVENIVKSLYLNICRNDYRTSTNVADKKRVLNSLFDHIISFLRHFNTPESNEKVFNSKRENHKYLGYSMKSILSIILYCFNLFKNKPAFEVPTKFHIFKLMLEKEPEVDNRCSESYSTHVEETLSRINVILLNTLQNVVMNITLDTFMDWVEVDLPGDDPEQNLQKLIGEDAYKVTNLININECFKHDVIKQLECISIKPREIQDIVKEANLGAILTNIESDKKNSQHWFNELLSRGECVFGNLECLQTILENIDLMDLEHFKLTLLEYKKYDIEEDELEKLHEIFDSCFQKFSKENLIDLLAELLTQEGHDFNLDYEDDELNYELINFTNKFTEDSIMTENYVKIIAKNPKYFYEILLERIDDNDEKQIEIILEILKETNKIASFYLKTLLQANIPQYSKTKSAVFLVGVFRMNLVERKEFLKDLLVHLGNALKQDNLKLLLVLLSVLKSICGRLNTEDRLPPVLVLLAHILDKKRWDLLRYSPTVNNIVDVTIHIVQELIKTVIVHGTEDEKIWIVKQIEKTKLLTKYYFQKLTLKKGESKKFEEFLHPKDFKQCSKDQIVEFLCENIVRCTSKEISWLVSNENLQLYCLDALLMIAVIVAKSDQESAHNCLKKCVSDYIKILQDKIIPAEMDSQKLMEIAVKSTNLIKQLPETLFSDLSIMFVDVFKKIGKFAFDNNKEEMLMELVKILQDYQDCEMKMIVMDYLNSLENKQLQTTEM